MERKAGPARTKGSGGAQGSSSAGLGAPLLQALTEQQLSGLLDAVLGLLGAEGRVLLSSRVDSETAEVLLRLRDGDPAGRKPGATRAKCLQEWELAWDRWHQATAELGIEDGRYVYQEHDWEAPSFDGEDFAENLDKVAQDILPLVERVSELGIEDKNLFREELLHIGEEADSYPPWMGESECTLGPLTTACFLKWEWCMRAPEGSGSQEFLERIRMTEEEIQGVALHDGAFVAFFDALSASSQREVLDAIRKLRTSALWQERFSSPHSKWHRVLNALLARFDTDSYLEDCMTQLNQEWSYGLPLIEHLRKKKELLRADEVLARTFASLLRFEPENRRVWIPEDELLVERLAYHSPFPDARIVKLLASAVAVARGRGDGERAAILDLQRVIYTDRCRWNEIAAAFETLLGSPDGGSARILLSRWERSMAEATLPHRSADENELVDTWVHWLIEAVIDEAKGPEWFQKRLKRWFTSLDGDSTRFARSRAQIIALAGDRPSVSSLKNSHPQFAKLARGEERYGVKRCARARREWLKLMGAESIVPSLIACAKTNAPHLVPDPAHAYGSRCEEHARWLRAIKEIDPAACQKIIERWKVQHKRRRNLWDSLKRGGLT